MKDNDKDKVVSLNSSKGRKKEREALDLEKKKSTASREIINCSFCGRPNTQVVKMVKGPSVNICSECTMIAVQYLILDDRMPSGEAQRILDMFWNNL